MCAELLSKRTFAPIWPVTFSICLLYRDTSVLHLTHRHNSPLYPVVTYVHVIFQNQGENLLALSHTFQIEI